LAIGEGVVTARAVIVTASTAVLASGRIRFRPNLPGAYASAFEKLKLGSYDHVALAFNGNRSGWTPTKSFSKEFTRPKQQHFSPTCMERASLFLL
jgi:hypothetical protein